MQKTTSVSRRYRVLIAVVQVRDQILAVMLDISTGYGRHIEQSARGYCR